MKHMAFSFNLVSSESYEQTMLLRTVGGLIYPPGAITILADTEGLKDPGRVKLPTIAIMKPKRILCRYALKSIFMLETMSKTSNIGR